LPVLYSILCLLLTHHTSFYHFTVPELSLYSLTDPTATPEIYTLSLHDALPIWSFLKPRSTSARLACEPTSASRACCKRAARCSVDRKSTRLNSSHVKISYAVFCLKTKIEK